jgi:hypothetical protein
MDLYSFPTPPEMTCLSKNCVSPSKDCTSLSGLIPATCAVGTHSPRRLPRRLNRPARLSLSSALIRSIPPGCAAEPWTTWALLHYLEQATGNASAAADAWQQAVQCYLAYRRAGGESQEPGAQLCALIAHAIRQGDTTEVTQFLAQAAAAADTPAWLKAMLPTLHAILHGDRDPALAADPALDYGAAAELLLLLETLGAG